MQSLFQPILTINDAGAIEIDWASSYVNTVDLANPEAEERYDDPSEHGEKLDAVLRLSEGTPADALRRLAAAVEGNVG